MAGAVAHHFNNQLQVVIGNLELSMYDPPGINPARSLTSAMQAARKAADVSDLILSYLGQTPGKLELANLAETCRQNITLLQAAAPKGISFEIDFPSPGPVIHANVSQMRRILTNLVTNAWESISDNQGTIRLTVKTVSAADIPVSHRFPIDWQPQESNHACLEVADTGWGVKSKDIDMIFDPFFSTKFTGRGMGLSVLLGIAGMHGGGVTLKSEPGRGSVFCVYLPVSTEKMPVHPKNTIPNQKVAKGGTVLLVEDEDQVRSIASIMLTRLGFRVLEAKDGLEAIEIFTQHKEQIRCVLSDLMMPHMDGWEILSSLRKLSPGIPIILSSGFDEAQVMADEHPESPNAFLGKPYQFQELREAICQALV